MDPETFYYAPEPDPLTMAADMLKHAAEILRNEGFAGLADHAESVAHETDTVAFASVMGRVAPAIVQRRGNDGHWHITRG